MPKMNGIEFLKILKADDILKYIPTIILTTSSNRRDLLECYKIGIAGYIIKPLKYEDYVSKLSSALDYWSQNELIKG
jgi:CheY-like chemotaxis protein